MATEDTDRLVLPNLPYAHALARRFHRPGLDVEDLEQEAACAMVEAARVFRPDQNPDVPFVAFARQFVVRRLGSLAPAEAMASLSQDLPAPFDTHQERAADELWSAMDVLTDREQSILVRRYGLDGRAPSEMEALCATFKLSCRRLTSLLEQARGKLKAELIARGWKDTRPTQKTLKQECA